MTGDRKAPHDEIAPLALSGAGAIYERVYGGERNTTATYRSCDEADLRRLMFRGFNVSGAPGPDGVFGKFALSSIPACLHSSRVVACVSGQACCHHP
jgi:hypothetical protein